MPQTARCKFTVVNVSPSFDGAPAGDVTVKMQTQYDPALAQEDAAFSTVTPWGSAEFGISNPNLSGFFEEGQTYYLDISRAD
jgi:hypothetical protein